MTGVGLSGALKYGTKFLGSVLAVLIASAVPVVAGVLVVATGGDSLLDLSLSSLSLDRVMGGLVLVLVGLLVGLAGAVGLAYKLIADATAAGGQPVSDAGAKPAGDATETTDEAAASGSTPRSAPGVAPADAETASSEASGDDTPADPATTAPAAAESVAGQSGTAGSGTGGETAAEAPPDEATAETAERGAEPRDEPGSGVDEVAAGRDADPDWRDSEYVTGTPPEETDGASGAERGPPDDPDAWHPPDPAEIEEAAAEPDPEPERTWEDVKDSASAEPGHGDGRSGRTGPEPDPETGRDSGGVPDAGAAGADEDASDPPGDGVAGADAQAGDHEPASDAQAGDHGPASDAQAGAHGPAGARPAEETDEDATTLADEGVESVDVAADEDPLADRLPDGDS